VTLHAPFMDLSAGSPDPAVRRITRTRFEQVLGLVPLFHPLTVVCHTGYDWRRYDHLKEAWLENSLPTWSWLAGELRDAGTKLMLENVYERGPTEIGLLLERLGGSNVGFCFDTGHMAAFSDCGFERWVGALGNYLEQVHLHDNHGSWDEHLAMGQGAIDFPSLFQRLRVLREEPPVVTLEPHREEDLRASLEYLDMHWPW
jgi:sugar phosphate isomerase/epimerase